MSYDKTKGSYNNFFRVLIWCHHMMYFPVIALHVFEFHTPLHMSPLESMHPILPTQYEG